VKQFALALFVAATIWPCGGSALAQSMDDLNLQIHGYSTQGIIYTTNNNWNTMNTSDGSAAWTEAVVNVSAQPGSKLRVGVQARYLLLGSYGNAITLDWAQADYKMNEHIGLRVGKVKTPTWMLNEVQDIDPAYSWILLPQSIYPIASRNTTLAHYGGVMYGTAQLGERLGSIEYRGFGGERVIAAGDGYFQALRDAGTVVPNGLSGAAFGGTLHWLTPVRGLMLGASDDSERPAGEIVIYSLQGTVNTPRFYTPSFFGRYDHHRVMVAGEYSRIATHTAVLLPGVPAIDSTSDKRDWYAMASYNVTAKLTAGVYDSSATDRQMPISSARFQKDWALSVHYDASPYLYLKAEQHFVDGTALGYSTSDNAALKPNTRMTLLKLGVSF
jgi:hypothetical protein